MKTLVSFVLLLICCQVAIAQHEIRIDQSWADNSRMPFVPRPTGLALNVDNDHVRFIREEISRVLDLDLRFFTGWEPAGEGHVTVITPPEIILLSPEVKQEEVDEIARRFRIQEADLSI